MPETVTFDHYEVLTRDDGSLYELGRGAMGITYKAFDTNLRVPVALKVINCANLNTDIARQRFVREARSAAKLRHRHVASVFHLGAEGDTYFYAMEFIDGETVEALIKRQGAIPPVLALRIALQVARALNAATQHGLVHRDIKPSNLMLVHEDEEVVVKVIDFGLAKSCVGEEDAATISMGGFVGTPHFASPEQLEDAEIDVRSDIYSLGVTLWYMLAGHTPFAGSMAQVMSQHLTKQPPFEKLSNTPPALSALLRRMLAKRPDDRFQTPNELRQEIEKCIESVSAAPIGAVPVTKIDEETFATVLDETHQTVEPTQFEAGSLVAGRYEIRQALGETNAGRMFHAYDQEQKIDVRMLVLLRDFTDDTNLYTQLEREVTRIVPVQHANLLRVYGLETVVPSSFVVVEWTEGFTLLELLRARRELGIEETLAILKQAAAGLDFAISAGLKRVDLALHQIFVDFGQNAQGREHWMRTPITEWPAFRVKLNPLGITRELSASETWAGGQTVVGGAAPLPDRSTQDDSRGVFIASLASIIYELLGGALSPLGPGGAATMRYTPLAGLSEEGNGVVKRAMAPASNAFPTAEAFARELGAVEERRIGLGAKKPDSRPAFPTRTSVPPTPAAAPPAAVARPRPRHRIPVGFIGGIATVATIATLLFLFLRSAPAPRTTTEPPPTPGGTPASSPAIVTSTPTPPQAMVATTPVPPTPAPTPARQDYLKAAITSAEVLETSGNRERAIRGWLKLIKQFPETDIGKVRLEMMLNNLRRDGETMSDEEFSAIREALTEAAHQDILAAQMLLGQELRERSPVDSFNWYSAAAAQGNAAALTQLGLMLSNGTGTQPDLEKAVACFQAAADQDEPAAQGALAECYLYGKGVEKDEKKAIGLLKDASDRGNVRAMNRLGTCYHQGVGVAQNFTEAYQLFKRASEMGYGEAMGNLGVLYINGEGVSRSPRKAVELFQKGAKAEDSYCMFLLARCYESGTGISANKLEAQNWYRRAAEAGHPRAAEWCTKNDVPFKKPD